MTKDLHRRESMPNDQDDAPAPSHVHARHIRFQEPLATAPHSRSCYNIGYSFHNPAAQSSSDEQPLLDHSSHERTLSTNSESDDIERTRDKDYSGYPARIFARLLMCFGDCLKYLGEMRIPNPLGRVTLTPRYSAIAASSGSASGHPHLRPTCDSTTLGRAATGSSEPDTAEQPHQDYQLPVAASFTVNSTVAPV